MPSEPKSSEHPREVVKRANGGELVLYRRPRLVDPIRGERPVYALLPLALVATRPFVQQFPTYHPYHTTQCHNLSHYAGTSHADGEGIERGWQLVKVFPSQRAVRAKL
ncbi:hypothetical protein FB45DRAFT_859243 [Roridomyces roridus]|uniref:Uncharacterized protein n=1 Tax=Roridomyces roridus TaxID=1738132 RepID=A0AAD7CJC5_9AGAR|nr:hypothetical protein FB45DRAFT_859243 [Roridomyces roridus]